MKLMLNRGARWSDADLEKMMEDVTLGHEPWPIPIDLSEVPLIPCPPFALTLFALSKLFHARVLPVAGSDFRLPTHTRMHTHTHKKKITSRTPNYFAYMYFL